MNGHVRPVENTRKLLDMIRAKLEDIRYFEGRRAAFQERYGPDADQMGNYTDRITEAYLELDKMIETTVLFPPYHSKHFKQLPAFFSDGSFEKSVFVMTKFPDARDAEKDVGLERIILTVTSALSKHGFIARLARGISQYHDSLWENVELHLLGCSRGIAIVEDKSKGELNPNIAMEWRFFRALGRPVLYLEEEDFGHQRADWQGLIKHSFRWNEPERDIEKGIEDWLVSARGRT